MNIDGISKLSKERLLDELKKTLQIDKLEKLSKDKISLELILIIFPELKNIKIFSKLDSIKKDILRKTDFILLLSLMIIDGTDNADYFLFKFNLSKKNQKRIKIINEFNREKINIKSFSENNMNKILYYSGKQAVVDIINFRIISLKKVDEKLLKLREQYENKIIPKISIGADKLMSKYKIPEGKQLGKKLKMIEEEWVKNNFKISDKQVEYIVKD
jgi:tRNA nucleotidyltransferase/poly(A) polymerase